MLSLPGEARAWRGPVLLLLLAGSLCLLYLARFATMSRVEVLRSDYLIVDTAGTLWRHGLGAQLYVDQVQGPVYSALAAGDHSGDLLFNHAPLSAVLAAPFSLLDQVGGHALWSIAQLAMVVAACMLVARAAPWPSRIPRLTVAAAVAVALAGAGTLGLVLQGQEVGEITLGLGAAYVLWRRNRLAWGGAALVFGAALAKPHLALGLLALLIGWRERRVIAGALAGGVAALLLSVVLVGWSSVLGFVEAAVRSLGLYPATAQSGFTGFFSTLLGPGAPAMAASAVCSVLALGCCVALGARIRQDRGRLELAVAGATALSLLVAPHLLTHDLVLLAPAALMTLAAATARDPVTAAWPGRRVRVILETWLVLLIASGLDTVVTLPVKLTPVALALVAWVAWRWSRSRAPESARDGDSVPSTLLERPATVA